MKNTPLLGSVAMALALATLTPNSCRAVTNPTAYANVLLSAVSNADGLYVYKIFTYTGPDNKDVNDAGPLGTSASVGNSTSLSGTSYVSLTNFNANYIYCNGFPSLTIKAYGNTKGTNAAANSSVTLGNVTSQGNCRGVNKSYSDPQTYMFGVVSFAPNDTVNEGGLFSCVANGG